MSKKVYSTSVYLYMYRLMNHHGKLLFSTFLVGRYIPYSLKVVQLNIQFMGKNSFKVDVMIDGVKGL